MDQKSFLSTDSFRQSCRPLSLSMAFIAILIKIDLHSVVIIHKFAFQNAVKNRYWGFLLWHNLWNSISESKTELMQKVIILLFLAISFVMMTLISYMKFQTILYLESTEASNQYQVDGYQYADRNQYVAADTK